MPLLFGLTLFLAAALGFLVQPLIARQLLPLAGGSPAVWTTCLVFFQLVLLAGYLYAHRMARSRWLDFLHAIIVLGILALLDRGISLEPAAFAFQDEQPVESLLKLLIASVGLPYLLLSTTAPLLQAWYARTRHNPYALYAASNAGSLLGLMAYPFLIEPRFTITEQRWIWKVAFAITALLILFCTLRAGAPAPPITSASTGTARPRWGRWIALSALTASLLASVTAHLSTDIAPMPLLWVIPLAIYLLTYIITFATWPETARRVMNRIAPMAICFSVVALLTQATEPMILVALVHLFGLLAIGLLCHGELAAARPDPEHLTRFYLAIALGGVLGSSVNALVAPLLFVHLGPIEYPIALVLAALVSRSSLGPLRPSDLVYPLAILGLTLTLSVVVPIWLGPPNPDDPAGVLMDRLLRGGLMFGIPVALSFALVWRPLRFALSLCAVLLVGLLMRTGTTATLTVERNFFGTLTVTRVNEWTYLTHGTTRHGMQKTGESPPQPRMYYHRRGPLGAIFRTSAARVGVVGLGCGAMAAYAQPGEHWTFFEIDPNVIAIARDERYFTFLRDSQGTIDIIPGDARRKLHETPDGTFDLLAIDAFSSDAVPVHLLTREALELYLRKLKPGGRLLLHLSNRYLDLASLAGRGFQSLPHGAQVWWEDDGNRDDAQGQYPSTWVIVARQPPRGFISLQPQLGPIWTDDYAPLQGTWKRSDPD